MRGDGDRVDEEPGVLIVRGLLLAMSMAWPAVAGAQEGVDKARLQKVEYRAHFEPRAGETADSGSRDGWESYPLAEDAGYDPTVTPETSGGVSALVREVAPTQDGVFRLGFIRRLHMVSGAGSSLGAMVRVPYARGPVVMRVSIFRGEKEETHAVSIPGGEWAKVDCPVGDAPGWITAVGVVAEIPGAVAGRPERVLMKDVRLTGMGLRRAELPESKAIWDASRELYYLRRSVGVGETIEVAAETTGITNAGWELKDPAGTLVAHGVGGAVRYRVAAGAAAGVWTLEVAGREAKSTALVLVRGEHAKGLLFDTPPAVSPELLGSIQKRRAIVAANAKPETGVNIAAMDSHWLLAGLPSYFSILSQTPELAMLTAAEYRATGDAKALAESRRLLAAIAGWPMWVHPWFPAHGYHSYYPMGISAKYVVAAEQMLGSDLPVEERKRLDRSLMELVVKPVFEEYVAEDRLQFNTSNWIGNTVGGALLAAMESDDPAAAGYVLGLYARDRVHVREAYTADGSYGEGVSYHKYDLETTALVAAAAKRVLGQSIDEWLGQADRYMRYATYGTSGLLDFGDSHVELAPANVFAYQASLNKSDSLTDFYFRYRNTGTVEVLSRVLFEGGIKPATKPVEMGSASTVFDQRGVVTLRDDWSPESAVVAMRAGKNFNHNHADQGSVFVAREGKLWLGEVGYADYYKDPSFTAYSSQAAGHNTLLVDGNGESQVLPGNAVFGAAPSVTHRMISDGASVVEADLAAAYGGSLQGYTRTLFYQAKGPLVVIDRTRSDVARTVTQVWHPVQTITSFDGAGDGFAMPGMTVRAFSPGGLKAAKKDSPMPLRDYERSERGVIERPVQVEFSSAAAAKTQTIVTVIAPPGMGEARWADGVLRMRDSGVRVVEGTISGWWSGGGFLLHGMRYEDDGRVIAADRPVDLDMLKEGGLVRVRVTAPEAALLKVTGYAVVAGSLHAEAGESLVTLKAQ